MTDSERAARNGISNPWFNTVTGTCIPYSDMHHMGAWCNSRVGHGLVPTLTRTVRAV